MVILNSKQSNLKIMPPKPNEIQLAQLSVYPLYNLQGNNENFVFRNKTMSSPLLKCIYYRSIFRWSFRAVRLHLHTVPIFFVYVATLQKYIKCCLGSRTSFIATVHIYKWIWRRNKKFVMQCTQVFNLSQGHSDIYFCYRQCAKT